MNCTYAALLLNAFCDMTVIVSREGTGTGEGEKEGKEELLDRNLLILVPMLNCGALGSLKRSLK